MSLVTMSWYGRVDLKLRLSFVVPPAPAKPCCGTEEDEEDDMYDYEAAEHEAFQRAVRVPSTPRMRASLMFMRDPDKEYHTNPRCCCNFSDYGESRAQPMERDDLAFALDSLSWRAL